MPETQPTAAAMKTAQLVVDALLPKLDAGMLHTTIHRYGVKMIAAALDAFAAECTDRGYLAMLAERDAAIARAEAAESCTTCDGHPHASGKVCICGGSGRRSDETHNLRLALQAAEAELEGLREIATSGPSTADSIPSPLSHKAAGEQVRRPERPRIVCLCGSTRFADTFNRENLRLTLEGVIVLSIGANVSDASLGIAQDSETKQRLDDLHLRKIDLADEVLVLNVGGYIGQSTRREIEYAKVQGKPIRYLEAADGQEGHDDHQR